ncbi:hypothetical protein [Pseudomonas veronii]|uniref:hypothetical protein n=1 Tax=Pseudomonas veronii TaxID=76761 RepID=UPI000B16F931|nr:hypothetical protein [Pseudomonas veronii]
MDYVYAYKQLHKQKKTKEGGIMKYEMIIIGLASAILAQASFAEYSVKIPLEVNMGGHLPNGSINIAQSGATAPNPYPDPSTPKPPVEPVKPAKPTLYTTTFPKPIAGSARYNNANGVMYSDSLGLRIFVETSALKNNTRYSMFYDDKNTCVVETTSCNWGASGGFSGGCSVIDSKITNGPKIKLTYLSGNCLIGDDYLIKIREL